MKLAVCISGQVREGVDEIDRIKRFFNNWDTDYFLYLWNDEEDRPKKLVEGYEPKAFIIHPDESFQTDEPLYPDPNLSGLKLSNISMLYAIMRANELRKDYELTTNTRYDCVVKTRADLRMNVPKFHPHDLWWHAPHQRNIYTARIWRDVDLYMWQGISDVLFYGSPLEMDILCDTYRARNDIRKHLLARQQLSEYYGPIGPEILLYLQGKIHNIYFREMGFDGVLSRDVPKHPKYYPGFK